MFTGTALAFYVVSVLGIMAYHAWFFVHTSMRDDPGPPPGSDDD